MRKQKITTATVTIILLSLLFLLAAYGATAEGATPTRVIWDLYDSAYNRYKDSKTLENMEDALKDKGRDIVYILEEHNLPYWLIALAGAESHFKEDTCSGKGACGVWQLTAPTARAYGLTVNDGVDERTSPIKATKAAAKYLKKHYERFSGNIPLVIAAYNLSSTPVFNAIHKHKTTDFKVLCAKKALPAESCYLIAKTYAIKALIDFKAYVEDM